MVKDYRTQDPFEIHLKDDTIPMVGTSSRDRSRQDEFKVVGPVEEVLGGYCRPTCCLQAEVQHVTVPVVREDFSRTFTERLQDWKEFPSDSGQQNQWLSRDPADGFFETNQGDAKTISRSFS
ncbi:hypothetical protein CRG98_033600 [Punica granatum]|uniref:Uncharacterized protein n=1 Tax=Punica granatum TaxID=22663 RepID=A0A2I0IQM5_PUNGR|nr:hypothetical protein CRG98_033600 [Punica granatum]